MSENNTGKSRQPQGAAVRRRRKSGVPTGMVALLMVLGLIIGALGGFIIGRRTDTDTEASLKAELQQTTDKLAQAEDTIRGYENSSELSAHGTSPDYVYSDNLFSDGLADLSGEWGEATDLWNEDTIMQGTISTEVEPIAVASYTYEGEQRELMSPEVIEEYNDQMTNMLFGGASEEDISDSLLISVMQVQIGEQLIKAEAEKMGLDELTEQDLRDIDAEAQQIYDEQLSYYAAFVTEPGMTDEQIQAAAAQFMQSESGVSLESITQSLKETWWQDKYYDAITKDVSVTDEEVKAHYDEVLADQKANFDVYPDEFMFAHIQGDPILYVPEGFRAVRDILIPFDNEADSELAADLLEQLELLDPTADAEQIAQVTQQLDELFAPMEDTAKEVLERLANGESFEALMDEFGCSDMLQSEPLRSEGFYINESAYINSTDFVQGSMVLEQPGQISQPLRSDLGIHLVQYIGDVKPGEVPLETVRQEIGEETLNLKKSEYYQEHFQALVDAADPQYYPERLQ